MAQTWQGESPTQLVANDKCPRCFVGELDTGWECNNCGYDAMPLVASTQANTEEVQ
jgi:hypothetical protein